MSEILFFNNPAAIKPEDISCVKIINNNYKIKAK